MSVLKMISITNSNRSCLAKTKIKGCIFYYGSCILGSIKKHGLIRKYWRSPSFNNWVKRLIVLCFLPANDIKTTWKVHLKKFSLFSAADRLQVENFKTYFEDQWIHNTEADFLSIFETEVNVTNENERFKKKMSKKNNTTTTLWNVLQRMNELLDLAALDMKCLKDKKTIVQKEPRMNEDDLKHRKYAEAQLLSKDFSAIQFVDFLAENFGTRFFQSIDHNNESENEAVIAGDEFDISKDFENIDDFILASDSTDQYAIKEEFSEINSFSNDENNFEINDCVKRGLKRDRYQETTSYEEEENTFLEIKKSRKSKQLDQNYELQESNINHDFNEISPPGKLNELRNNYEISGFENSECSDEGKVNKNKSQVPNDKCKKKPVHRFVTEEYQGLNYTLQNNVYLHEDGHSYQKIKLNKAETTVFLRCQFF